MIFLWPAEGQFSYNKSSTGKEHWQHQLWFIAGSIKVALGIVNWEIGRYGGHSRKSLRGLVCPIPYCQFSMPKATFIESAICGKRTANCYIVTRLTVIPSKRFYMLANERARITGWQSRLLLYKGRDCCIFLTTVVALTRKWVNAAKSVSKAS